MSSAAGGADEGALQFGWLWLSHQFSDFVLELHIHPPLQQEEGDEGEGALSAGGLIAPSPIKRACTPAVPPPIAAAAPALPLPFPPPHDAGGRAAGRPPWEEDAGMAAAAAEAAGGGGAAADDVGPGGGYGEGRNVRFTSLQSRQVAAAAAATALGGGGGGGRGRAASSSGVGAAAGRRGGKAQVLGSPPGSAGGHRLSMHGQGMSSFATIERRGPSAAAAVTAVAVPSASAALAASAAVRRPTGRRPPPPSTSSNTRPGAATAAAAAAEHAAAGPPSRPAGPVAGRSTMDDAAARSAPAAAAATATPPPTAAAMPPPAAARPQPLPSLQRLGPGGAGGGAAAAAVGAAADTLPGRDQRSPSSSPRRDGSAGAGGSGRSSGGGAGGDQRGRRRGAVDGRATREAAASGGVDDGSGALSDARREAGLDLSPAGPHTARESADGSPPAEAAAAALAAASTAAAAAANALAITEGSAAASAFGSAARTPLESSEPAAAAPPSQPETLATSSSSQAPRPLPLARSYSAPAPQEVLAPYDLTALDIDGVDVDVAGTVAAVATPTGWEAADGLEPSGSWEEELSYDEAVAAAAAAKSQMSYGTAAVSPASRRDSWASGIGEALLGGGSGAVCWGAGAATGGTTRSLGRSAAAAAAAAPPPRPRPVRVFPVHAAVLAATSDYFRTLLQNWSCGLQQGAVGGGGAGGAGGGGGDGRGVLTMYVEEDQVEAAEMMLRFMYTGLLPAGLGPSQLLSLLVLADQYAVGRLLAAVDAAFAGLPLPGLSLEQLLRLYELPEVLLAGGALASALSKLVDKLISELGDLELVLDCPARRAQLLGLPYEAVRLLLQSPDTRVWNENTAVAALVEWVAGPEGATTSLEQRRQLAASLRLQHCTHSYLSYIIPQIPWLVPSLDPTRLLLALSWSRADASTRDVYTAERYFEAHTGPAAPQQIQQQQQQALPHPTDLHPDLQQQPQGPLVTEVGWEAGGSAAADAAAAAAPQAPQAPAAPAAAAAPPPPLPVFVARPRPVSQRVTFDWSIDFATLQQLYADSRATRSLQVVTSEPAFFGGFHWWLRYDLDASQPPEYREHMGLACNVKLAGRKHSLPCVKVKATVCARQDAGVLGEGSYSLRKSFSYHVMNACPVGLWGFFGLTPDRDEAAWRRFVFEGRVWLRCSIEECQ